MYVDYSFLIIPVALISVAAAFRLGTFSKKASPPAAINHTVNTVDRLMFYDLDQEYYGGRKNKNKTKRNRKYKTE